MDKPRNSKIIRSSEISSYVYCPYAWWDSRVEGVVETKEMVAGGVFHQDYMVKQQVARKLNVTSYVVLALILLLILFVMSHKIGTGIGINFGINLITNLRNENFHY